MSIKQEELATYYAQKYPLTFAKDVIKHKGQKLLYVFDFFNLKRPLFTFWSDVDLAVWGITDDKFYAAVGVVTRINSDFKVDLIDAQACRDSLCKTIESEGIEV
ncbi:MAG: nucleotidyltransferase domain-containing protein [Firmicutes bacterium HGW-Firmicutes-12]|nr:MAG: nucleotidyltransferase domain-containing protein [Firmicutes bacterium HGW-Firmicutes-12]